ncbi:MAG: hypothetical protein IJ191_10175 [Treponema sp.]|nr:hypothetical protein [Treponema sp.]
MFTATVVIGLCAALLLFSGDMLLYFTPDSYEMDGTFAPYIGIMSQFSERRIIAGGILGPIAAFLYCIGCMHFYFVFRLEYRFIAFVLGILFVFGCIIGGAYHSHFPYLGLVCENDSAAKKVSAYIQTVQKFFLFPLMVSELLFTICIVCGITYYPRWFALCTPCVTYFLGYIMVKLPQPFRAVLFGGWYNLMFAIYYAAVLIWLAHRTGA